MSKKFLLLWIVVFLVGVQPLSGWREGLSEAIIEIPGSKAQTVNVDNYQNFWVGWGEEIKDEASLERLRNYLHVQHAGYKGIYVFVPNIHGSIIDHLEGKGFIPYRLEKGGQILLDANGRGIPEQFTAVLDTRIFIVDMSTDHVLMIKDRGAENLVAPGGCVQPGELILDGARRELKEEVGIDLNPQTPLYPVFIRNMSNGKVSNKEVNTLVCGFVVPITSRPEIKVDPKELEWAVWVPLEDLKNRNSRILGRDINALYRMMADQLKPETSETNITRISPTKEFYTYAWSPEE